MSAPLPPKILGRTNIHGDLIYDFEIGQHYEINGEIMQITRIDREHGSRAQLVLENIKTPDSDEGICAEWDWFLNHIMEEKINHLTKEEMQSRELNGWIIDDEVYVKAENLAKEFMKALKSL